MTNLPKKQVIVWLQTYHALVYRIFLHLNIFICKFFPIRNAILDKTSKFASGQKFSKKDLLSLKKKASSEVTCGFNFTDIILNCVQSDRQRVPYARQLFSSATVTMIRNFYKNDPRMQEMADLFDTLDQVCHLFTSRQIIDKENKAKSALGSFLDKQLALLLKLHKLIDEMTFDGKKMPFQKAMKMAIMAAINLHKLMSEEYGLPFLMLAMIVQDHVESLFMIIRECFGPENKPQPLDCRKRMDHHLRGLFLEDKLVDIYDLEEAVEVQQNLEALEAEEDIVIG